MRLPKSVSDWISKQRVLTRVTPLAGDGSQRTFYRVSFEKEPQRPQTPNRVLLSDPGWSLSKDYAPHQAYLAGQGLPVPRFFEEDPKEGLLLMEDLGDELLQMRLISDPEKKTPWLLQAAELLADLHGKTFPVPKELPVSNRSFDTQKYFEEFSFTLEHLHTKFLGLKPLEAKVLDPLRRYCEDIAGITPSVFCHRDYHSRNLVLAEESLYLIDFQDARLGSPQYDVASLIYDPYVPLDESEREELVVCYKKTLSSYPLSKVIDWKGFHTGLEKVGFQRVVKAAGSFASFQTRFGKSTHLPYLVPALKTAARLRDTLKLPKDLGIALPIDEWLRKAEKKGLK